MASPTSGAPILPDYAPVPRASLGPAVNDQGYYVGRTERNLYWAAFPSRPESRGLHAAILMTWLGSAACWRSPCCRRWRHHRLGLP